MKSLALAVMATLLSTCSTAPVFAQATALPRADFDPILVDLWGGSPEVINPKCFHQDRIIINSTDETGWTFLHKDFFLRLQIKDILNKLFEKEPR